MPWSPLLYEKQILESIMRNITEDNKISSTALHRIMMRETKMIGNTSLSNAIRAFSTLGYIEPCGDGILFNVFVDNIAIRLMQLREGK